jgi:hypothetical protein
MGTHSSRHEFYMSAMEKNLLFRSGRLEVPTSGVELIVRKSDTIRALLGYTAGMTVHMRIGFSSPIGNPFRIATDSTI